MPDEERVPNVSPEILTPAELRVVKLLSAGCATSDIAQRISGSPDAVECLYDSIYQKVGVSDRAALVRWAAYFDVARW